MSHTPYPTRPDKKAKMDFVSKYKLERGCKICGYKESAYALDLDHIDRSEKTFKLSDAHSVSWERLHEELAKCEVLCANCHRIKTQEEKDFFSVDREELDDPQIDLL